MRRGVVPAAVIGAILTVLVAPCPAGHLALTKGPYIQNPQPTAITVQWETDQPGSGQVRFKAAGSETEQAVEGRLFDTVPTLKAPRDEKAPRNPRYLYRARLMNLEPDTEYTYSVVVTFENGTVTSGERTLRTWPEKGPERVTFIAYGDTRSQPEKHRGVVKHFNEFDPAFVLNVGDLVWDGEIYGQFSKDFFDPLHDVIDHIPMFIGKGNHDRDAKYLLRLFDMPGGRMYYAFDYGPVHVVVLDNVKREDKPKTAVLKWLARDLAATRAAWRFVMYHTPTFNLEGHKSDACRTTYLPLFEKYDVDFVFTGHSHQYERFVPLRRSKNAEGQPITFMTVGAGGAPLHRSLQNPLLASAAAVYCFTVFTVDERTLTLRTITDKGEEIDSLAVTKTGGRYDDAYLAKTRTLEDAILAQGLLRMDWPSADGLPTPEHPVDLKLKTSFPGLEEPATVSVRLAESSQEQWTIGPAMTWVEPTLEEIKVPVALRPLGEVGMHQRQVWERQTDRDALAKKTFLFPEVSFWVTASAGGIQQEREVVGVLYNKAGRPSVPKPRPWGEPSEKKPSVVGKTYKPPESGQKEPGKDVAAVKAPKPKHIDKTKVPVEETQGKTDVELEDHAPPEDEIWGDKTPSDNGDKPEKSDKKPSAKKAPKEGPDAPKASAPGGGKADLAQDAGSSDPKSGGPGKP